MHLRSLFIYTSVALYALHAAAAEDRSLQILRGTLVPCEIDVPSSWQVLGTNQSVIAAKGDGMMIMLSSDPKNLGDSYTSVKIDCDGARQLMPDAKWTEARPIKIAGYEWLEFTVTATVNKQPTTFLNYTFSGHPGTFTIIGVVATEQFTQKRDFIVHYMSTFRFPKLPASAASAKP